MDRFEAMRAYVHVVDSGSYTRAARQLNVHKATVSQQIQQLEQQLGVRLLTRTTRSVAPTPEGLDYYRHACAIVQQVEQAESHLRKGVSAPAGHLRVNVPVALARQVFDFAWAPPPWVALGGALAGALLAWVAGWWSLRDVLRRPVVQTLRQAVD